MPINILYILLNLLPCKNASFLTLYIIADEWYIQWIFIDSIKTGFFNNRFLYRSVDGILRYACGLIYNVLTSSHYVTWSLLKLE